ncbi:MAG: GMP/IMP nucleotidase [Nitrospira sp.]|nr:GMP/IMP nucleotidase [Candidatus Manganitrophaceae bacterium]HIL33834.1 GMP/IMP nucleotidase [Candidatus Manganitrophaceae bacterium]
MIPWEKIDTVLLDMDGTLLDRYFDDYFWEELVPEKFSDLRGISLSEAKKLLYAAFKGEERTLNWTDIYYWSDRLGLDIVALKVEMSDQVRVHLGVLPFLKFIQDGGKEVVLVTNAHPKTVQIKLGQTDLSPYLDTILCSSDIGVPKEDLEFWRGAERVLLFDKSKTLFVDDNEAVLRAADSFGIKYLLQKNNASSRRVQSPPTTFRSLDHFDSLIP